MVSRYCQQNLYFQRQLREILAREKDRVDRVWLVTDDAPVAPGLLPALNTAHVLRLDAASVQNWISPAQGQQLQDHLWPAAQGATSLRTQALLQMTVPQQPSAPPAFASHLW